MATVSTYAASASATLAGRAKSVRCQRASVLTRRVPEMGSAWAGNASALRASKAKTVIKVSTCALMSRVTTAIFYLSNVYLFTFYRDYNLM